MPYFNISYKTSIFKKIYVLYMIYTYYTCIVQDENNFRVFCRRIYNDSFFLFQNIQKNLNIAIEIK
jgi:hypothetical protein